MDEEVVSEIYYPQPEITGFEEFERAYEAYIEKERLPDICRPAISAANLFKRPKLSVITYVPGFVYAGAINLIAGEPKAGKSTLILHLTNAISLGKKFLDKDTVKANVLYVTEQNEVSFREEASKAPGLMENENFYILMPEENPFGSWEANLDFWGQKLVDTHSSVLVIDTFGSYSHLQAGGENDASVVAEKLMSLKKLFRHRPNLGIILAHHVRKPSVDPRYGEKEFVNLRDARGSTALAGGTDHCIMLSKSLNAKNARNLHIEGRFEKERELVVELSNGIYSEVEPPSFQRASIRRW
jgi:hypothetical protein